MLFRSLVCDWLEEAGFERRVWPVETPALAFVGAHRFTEAPRPLGADRQLFRFEL